MKKNILTIIIMAISLVNTALLALIIFSIVPAANETNKLVKKVASIVDLELESPNADDQVGVADIESYPLPEAVTCSLKSNDATDHFLSVEVTLQQNMKSEDFETLKPKLETSQGKISEIVETVFSKYTKDELKLQENKDKAKQDILTAVKDYFESDFIIDVVLSKFLIE